MIAAVWDTREPLAAAFRDRWAALAAEAPQFNFSMDAACLAHEAAQGRHALAAILEDGGRRAALVLRREGPGFVSGHPWRWQLARAAPPEAEIAIPSAADCAWGFRAAGELARGARVHVHLPAAPPRGTAGYAAGGTLLLRLDPPEEALLAAMDVNKRRAVRKAAKEGFSVTDAGTLEELRAYHQLQLEENEWRGPASAAPASDAIPATGQGWREWELPWMRLLVAARSGVVEAGSGFALSSGGTMDYRANASTPAARKAGANAQLAYAAIQAAKQAGCRLMNWGGVTEFKRELGGVRTPVWCWLGGGGLWKPANHFVAGSRNAQRALAARWKTLRAKEKSNP